MAFSLANTVGLLQLVGEPSRVRLMALLAKHELTVAELVSVTDLPQSSVSTHLGRLREAGALRDRRAGSSTFYSLANGAMPAAARELWALVESRTKDAVLDGDRERAEALVRAREKAWPDAVAGQMERHYSPGRTWEALARGLLGVVRLGDVLDVGCGDGAIAQLVAPRARSVTCLDKGERVLDAARARLAKVKNARVVAGDAATLPFKSHSFDQVLLLNVLADVEDPARVVAEAARVLRPGGDIAIVTLGAHDHVDVASAYGHVHAGFAPDKLRRIVRRAGLALEGCDVVCREKRPPHFEVVCAFASKRKNHG